MLRNRDNVLGKVRKWPTSNLTTDYTFYYQIYFFVVVIEA